jgi:hypothetical protein
MANLDLDWVKEQLTQNKTKKMTGDAVLQLLDTWQSIKRPPKTDISKDIIDVFSKLALGHALIKTDKNETWIPVQSGAIKVSEIVRVKFDAFDEESGKHQLNGRKGRVVGVRYGDIIIKTDDNKLPVLDGTHFRPENLEKLIQQ